MALSEFEKAFNKYSHFFKHARVDKKLAFSIEGIQQEAMRRASSLLDLDSSLEDNVRRLKDSLILDTARELAKLLGDEVADADEAYRAALEGRLEEQGARAMLLAIQAIARAYAEAKLERDGQVYEPGSYCPVCGLQSRTMVRRRGRYYMVCHFCAYEWLLSSDLKCPYCGESNPVAVGVFGDKGRRVMLAKCHTCGSTWRVIMDETIRAPRILLPLIALKAEAFRSASERSGFEDSLEDAGLEG